MPDAKPKCPSCGVAGTEYITCDDGAVHSNNGDSWFDVAYCDECGHVYGVFAKIVHKPSINIPDIPTVNFPHRP
jgi:hypothetical protein